MKLKKMTKQDQAATEQIADVLRKAKYAIALTGAGISTDSGIPDFRSPKTGLWNQKDALLLTEPGAFEKALEFFWAIGYKIGKKIISAKPNLGHNMLAKWEAENDLIKAVITQNVDGLHQKAGSKKVIELHGTAHEATCPFCRGSYTMKRIMAMYKESGHKPPTCIVCSSPLRPNVVLFGDPLPQDEVRRALEEIQKCDVAILLGSSSVVYPANYLPVLVKKKEGKVIIINQVPTELDQIADIVVHGSISPVLKLVDSFL